MAGMSCARRLAALGHDVVLFDKGRGPGGRMASRRIEHEGRTLRFDHGAQYFTARDQRFQTQVDEWEQMGVVARWDTAGKDAWVGTPAMNAPLKAMSDGLDVRFGTRVEAIEPADGGWQLVGEGTPDARFDTVVVAVPAEQAAPLLSELAPVASDLAARTVSDPCWTLMVAFESPVQFQGDTIREDGPIGWAARNNSKPGRESDECWVVQGSPAWSRQHLEDDAASVAAVLLGAFTNQVGGDLPPVLTKTAHRWRYARSGSAAEGHWWDSRNKVGVCGDWLIAPRVEAAFLSGLELAEAIGTAG